MFLIAVCFCLANIARVTIIVNNVFVINDTSHVYNKPYSNYVFVRQ